MRLSILCSDPMHPVTSSLKEWKKRKLAVGHDVNLVYESSELTHGDLLFLVSCTEFIEKDIVENFGHVLVLHASDLPEGRGWSPHIWQILGGANSIVVSLIEASEPIDTGKIWLQDTYQLAGHELLPEINALLFDKEIDLMSKAVDELDSVVPREQKGEPGEYLRKRTPLDSELDTGKTIAEQFNILRIADSSRHPAFFVHRGHKYVVKIEKAD